MILNALVARLKRRFKDNPKGPFRVVRASGLRGRAGVVGRAGQARAGAGSLITHEPFSRLGPRGFPERPARLADGEPRWPDRRDLHGKGNGGWRPP